MPTERITKRLVDATAPGERPIFLWDSEVAGFGLKVLPSGSRMYIFQFRIGGRGARTQRMTIGSHGTWTPDAARDQARRLAQQVRSGTDPAAALAERRRRQIDLAVPVYFEQFVDRYLKANWQGSWKMAAGLLKREALPVWRSKSLDQITRADVSALLDRTAARPATRRNLYAVLRRLFRWSVSRGDLEASPIRDMEAPPAPNSRDRVLSDDEIRAVWLRSTELGYPFGPFFQLLMLTGQRREEVAGMRWEELDRRDATWLVPKERVKTRVTNLVPLTKATIELIDELASVTGRDIKYWPRSGYVLSGTGSSAVSGFSRAKRRLDQALANNDASLSLFVDPWRIHDLRRTVATGLQRLGVRFEVTEAVLNHSGSSRSGVAGVYQRYDWGSEKRSALEAWSEHLMRLIAPSHGTRVDGGLCELPR